MNTFFGVLAMAVMVEGITEYVRNIVVADRAMKLEQIIALALGVLLCLAYGLDLLTLLGIEPVSPALSAVGVVLTGIAVSRGANYVSDLLKKLLSLKAGEA